MATGVARHGGIYTPGIIDRRTRIIHDRVSTIDRQEYTVYITTLMLFQSELLFSFSMIYPMILFPTKLVRLAVVDCGSIHPYPFHRHTSFAT